MTVTVSAPVPSFAAAVPLETRSAAPVLPVRVAAALGLLGLARGVGSAEWRAVQDQLGDRPAAQEDLAVWVESEMQVVEAVETLQAWADAHGLAALARMHQAVGSQCQILADTRTWRLTSNSRDTEFADASDSCDAAGPSDASWAMQAKAAEANAEWDVRAETDTATVDEVMLATGLPEGEVRRRLALAVDRNGRGSVLHAGLAAGQVSLYRATTMHQATAALDTQVARAVCVRLLQTNPDESTRSHRWFTQTLHRQVLRHTTDLASARHDALTARRAYASMDDTGGTATLVATGDATRVTAAMDRVERLARRLRGDGDARTLDQLRSDITIDLILYGWTTTTPGNAESTESTDGTEGTANAGNAGGSESDDSTESGGAGESLHSSIQGVRGAAELALFTRLHQDTPLLLGPTTFVGAPPPAQVHVVVSLTTLLGLDDGTGEIPGWGPIDAAQTRLAAVTAGSVWRRLVTDPLTATTLELSTGRYRPTPAMADLIGALDGTCRAPGCTIAAATCDLDHNRPWPHGDSEPVRETPPPPQPQNPRDLAVRSRPARHPHLDHPHRPPLHHHPPRLRHPRPAPRHRRRDR